MRLNNGFYIFINIEKVDGPTPWVSPIVIAPKPKNPNEIRLCVDMREPNKAILRSRHITPTLDDMILDLNGSKVFPKMNLRNGYHQLELSEDSRNITSNPSSTLLSVFWNISAAEETPKLKRLYLRNPTCVVNVVMFRESSLNSS
jgi:hypothetical protein